MIVNTEYADISLSGSPMRTFVAAPTAEGQCPGIWCYSDIFQLTPPMLRTCVRLAGYGFVAAAPEIYRRIEPPGTVIRFDDAGATGIHDGKLGQDADAGSLARAAQIRGELLMIFGTNDPHVPEAGRETIDRALQNSDVRYNTLLYAAEHAFTRDEGPRFDPEATDLAFAEMVRLFRRVFHN